MDQTETDKRNEMRDEAVLDAAWRIVSTRGLSALTRDAIAAEAGLSAASVSNFGRTRITNGDHPRAGYRDRIMTAMMDRANMRGDTRVLQIGLADGCIKCSDVAPTLRPGLCVV